MINGNFMLSLEISESVAGIYVRVRYLNVIERKYSLLVVSMREYKAVQLQIVCLISDH